MKAKLFFILITLLIILAVIPLAFAQTHSANGGHEAPGAPLLVGSIFSTSKTAISPENEIYVRYLGNTSNVSLRILYLNESTCVPFQSNATASVAPLEIVNLTPTIPGLPSPTNESYPFLIFVEDQSNNSLLDEAIIGIKYINNKTSAENLWQIKAPNVNDGSTISTAGIFGSNSTAFGLFPRNILTQLFLTTSNTSAQTGVTNVQNFLALTTFNTSVTAIAFDSRHDQGGDADENNETYDCSDIVSTVAALSFANTGTGGIQERIPPAATNTGFRTTAGVSSLTTNQTNGRLFGEYLLNSSPGGQGLMNFIPASTTAGDSFNLTYAATSPLSVFGTLSTPQGIFDPQGLFTGADDNFQTGLGDGAILIGVQKGITGATNITDFDTLFTVYNSGSSAKTYEVQVRYRGGNNGEGCFASDFHLPVEANGIGYFRASEVTPGPQVLFGLQPLYSAVAIFDPQASGTMYATATYLIGQIAPECNDGVDNDGDGGTDYDGTTIDSNCTTAQHNNETGTTNQPLNLTGIAALASGLTLDRVSYDSNNRQFFFPAAESGQMMIPTIKGGDPADFNVITVNLNAFDDITTTTQNKPVKTVIADEQGNEISRRIGSQTCAVAVTNKASFDGDIVTGEAFRNVFNTSPTMLSYTFEYDSATQFAGYYFFNPNGLDIPSGGSQEGLPNVTNVSVTPLFHAGEIHGKIITTGVTGQRGDNHTFLVAVTPGVQIPTSEQINATLLTMATGGSVLGSQGFEPDTAICSRSITLSSALASGRTIIFELTGCAVDPTTLSPGYVVRVESATLGTGETPVLT